MGDQLYLYEDGELSCLYAADMVFRFAQMSLKAFLIWCFRLLTLGDFSLRLSLLRFGFTTI